MKIELNSIFNFYKINYDLHLKQKKMQNETIHNAYTYCVWRV